MPYFLLFYDPGNESNVRINVKFPPKVAPSVRWQSTLRISACALASICCFAVLSTRAETLNHSLVEGPSVDLSLWASPSVSFIDPEELNYYEEKAIQNNALGFFKSFVVNVKSVKSYNTLDVGSFDVELINYAPISTLSRSEEERLKNLLTRLTMDHELVCHARCLHTNRVIAACRYSKRSAQEQVLAEDDDTLIYVHNIMAKEPELSYEAFQPLINSQCYLK
ncbi:MAG: hypothetical protein KI792_08875 [Alphaproteobacteria bacterium]|nr:hypothetical protein [Alphaproteobacteria bacterium SS10]